MVSIRFYRICYCKRGAFSSKVPITLHRALCPAAIFHIQRGWHRKNFIKVNTAKTDFITLNGFKHGLHLGGITGYPQNIGYMIWH